jgi:hypothetical protein
METDNARLGFLLATEGILMRATIRQGSAAAMLFVFGLIAGNSSVFAPTVQAQPPTPVPAPTRPAEAPQAVPVDRDRAAPPPLAVTTPLAEAPHSVVIRFVAHVSPIFEGGAVGQPVPFTVEIRGDRLFNPAWLKKVPEKVKEALQAALAEAADEEPPADRRLDQVLERLDKIEKRLKHIERQKSYSDGR